MTRPHPRLLPNLSKTCTVWPRTRHHWGAVSRSRSGTWALSTNTTACRATAALPAPVCKTAPFTWVGILLIPCQPRAPCSTSVISPTPHPPVWTTAVPLRSQETTTMDPVIPIPHTQTSPLTKRLREGFRKRLNSRICNMWLECASVCVWVACVCAKITLRSFYYLTSLTMLQASHVYYYSIIDITIDAIV